MHPRFQASCAENWTTDAFSAYAYNDADGDVINYQATSTATRKLSLFISSPNFPYLVSCLSTHQLPPSPVISAVCQSNGTWDVSLSACVRKNPFRELQPIRTYSIYSITYSDLWSDLDNWYIQSIQLRGQCYRCHGLPGIVNRYLYVFQFFTLYHVNHRNHFLSVTCLSTHQLPATPVVSATCQSNGTWDASLSACIRKSFLSFICCLRMNCGEYLKQHAPKVG